MEGFFVTVIGLIDLRTFSRELIKLVLYAVFGLLKG